MAEEEVHDSFSSSLRLRFLLPLLLLLVGRVAAVVVVFVAAVASSSSALNAALIPH